MRSKRLQTITLMLAITASCTMILALVVYHFAAEALKREITNAYHVSLLHTRDRMETYLRHLDQATMQFEKISEVERFIAQDKREGIDRLTMISIMQRIHTSVEYVDNVVVFDARSEDLHVTNTAMNPVYSDYRPIIDAFFASNEKRAFLNMTVNDIPVTVYARKMPAFGPQQPVLILYHINQHIFDDFLGDGRYSDTGSYFVINKAGDLLASRGLAGEDAMSAWVGQINEMKSGVPETKIGSFATDDSFITFLPASFDGWVYAFSISNNAFLHQIGKIRNVILIISTGLFAAAIFISIISSHWLWRGWNRIRTLLEDQHYDEVDGNEFDRLLTKMRNVLEQSNQLKQQMNEMMPTVKDTIVLSLLENGVRTAEDWHKVSQYGINLLPGVYGCIALELDADWEQGQYSERDMLTFEYAVISVMREVIEQIGQGFAVRTDNGLMAAIISAEGEDAKALQQSMLQMADTIHQFIQQHFPINVSLGVSRARSNFSHLNIAYREARELLCNKLIAGGNRIFTFEKADGSPKPDQFPFQEVENDIVYGIRTRNRDYAWKSADQLYRLKDIPNIQYKWLQSKLVETAHSIFRQIRKSCDIPATQNEPTLNELLALSTLDDWVGWFRQSCIDPLVDQLNMRHQSQSKEAVSLMRAYIKLHLETDLRMEACCKSLHLPVSFAKQAMKETLDITFTELVLQERIERAKEWLQAGLMNVDEIARRLQYSNAQNFSRTFKKLVGMPPGQYRSVGDDQRVHK